MKIIEDKEMQMIVATVHGEKCLLKHHMDQFWLNYYSTFLFLPFFSASMELANNASESALYVS